MSTDTPRIFCLGTMPRQIGKDFLPSVARRVPHLLRRVRECPSDSAHVTSLVSQATRERIWTGDVLQAIRADGPVVFVLPSRLAYAKRLLDEQRAPLSYARTLVHGSAKLTRAERVLIA
jgi:hypothetical protein